VTDFVVQGATIVNEAELVRESDIGTGCGLFEIRKIGDEYFTFIEECKDPKACTIILTGASKGIFATCSRFFFLRRFLFGG